MANNRKKSKTGKELDSLNEAIIKKLNLMIEKEQARYEPAPIAIEDITIEDIIDDNKD